jgi:hypothetical protein
VGGCFKSSLQRVATRLVKSHLREWVDSSSQPTASGNGSCEIPARGVGGRFKSSLQRMATGVVKSHPREWVDASSPTYTKQRFQCFSIPPTAVGGSFKSSLHIRHRSRCCLNSLHLNCGRLDLNYPPTPGWDLTLCRCSLCRLDLKHPPTAVGGIRATAGAMMLV